MAARVILIEVEKGLTEQLDRYREYFWKTKQSVYIVLGVGGKLVYPEHLYVLPLSTIKGTKLNWVTSNAFERIQGQFLF